VSVSETEVERRLGVYAEAFRKRGMRLTHQRLEVAREVARSTAHPDVETVYRAVRERVPTISLDTVYRTFAVLVELGLVSRVITDSGPSRYDANPLPHHHFMCVRCGLICDLYSPDLDVLDPPERASCLGEVYSVQVQFRGACEQCNRKENDRER
jgi:Fur family transcriptional regulator, peroxide stress response regulator